VLKDQYVKLNTGRALQSDSVFPVVLMGIPLESGVGKEADIMCNLSEWIEEDALKRGEKMGRAKGKAEGRAEGEAELILTMHKKGYTAEQIADMTDKAVEEVRGIIEKMELLPV